MADSTPVEAKRCPRCRTVKPRSEYCRDRQKADGLTARCKECRSRDYREYAQSEAAKESARNRMRKWRDKNPDKTAAQNAAWRTKYPDYSAESNRRWREQNPGAAAAYHAANRDKTMARVTKRRRAMKDATFGPVDLDLLWERQAGACGICLAEVDPFLAYPDPMSKSVDHIVPLSRGGTHEQSNLQWTHLVCNLRKGAKVPDFEQE